MKRVFMVIAACALTLSAQAACYRVYNTNRLIHQSGEAPVDTRYEYHKTVPKRFGQGATLVYESGSDDCPTASTSPEKPRAYSNQDAGANRRPSQRKPKTDRG